MSKGEVIDFVVLRIQNELDKYNRTKTIPHTILDGTYDIEEINNVYFEQLSKRYQNIAQKLITEYYAQIEKNLESLKKALRKEYSKTISNLSTEHDSFKFRHINTKYRNTINPVRALYYEARELVRRNNPESDYHIWLKNLLTDKNFNNIILDALLKDIKKLERIVKRYYFPIVKKTNGIPLELVHAKTTIKDFRHYYTFFEGIKHWDEE